MRVVLFAAWALLLSAPVLRAQGNPPISGTPTTATTPPVPPQPMAEPLNMVDGNFLDNEARAEQGLISLARLGEQRGGTDAVRRFAATLADNHTRSAETLAQIGRAVGIQAPQTIGQGQQAAMDTLLSAGNDRFDAAFTQAVTTSLHRMQAAVRDEQATHNSDLHAYVARMDPLIRSELDGVGTLPK